MKKQLLVGAAIVGLMASAPMIASADHHEGDKQKAGSAGCGDAGCQGKAKEMMNKKQGKKTKGAAGATATTETAPTGQGAGSTTEPTK